MHVLFDHQIYCNQNYGGISRYFYELSCKLTLMGNKCTNSILFSENEFTWDPAQFHARKFIPFHFKGRARIKEYLNRRASIRMLREGNFDVLHPTYYDTYYLGLNRPERPLVATFHDLIHEKFASRYPKHLKNIRQVTADRIALLQSATAVIAVSESTKKDIVEHYRIDPMRIYVTHLAGSLPVPDRQPDPSWGDYILFVGNRQAYKNFDTFISAIAPLLRKEKNLKVICAGGGGFSKTELGLINYLNIFTQVCQIPINDQKLATLYSHALFFVFPSLYEGFGIPILEAFSCGCPAILSDKSSLPEVGGNAALYIDPESTTSILAQVEALYYSPALRELYRQKGLCRAENFSWTATAQKTLNIYESIL